MSSAHSTPQVVSSPDLTRYLSVLWPDGVREDSYLVASGGKRPAFRAETLDAFARAFPAWESAGTGTDGFSGGWIGVGQVSRAVDGRGPHARGALHEVTALPGVWLDVDLASPKKPRGAARETLDAVLAELAGVQLAPSMVVRSGPYGVHVYWLFREPLDLAGEDRARALARHAEVHAYLHRVVQGMLCERMGDVVALDRLIDVTRVLRPAGGHNLKPEYGSFPVTIESLEGRRYSPDDLEAGLAVLDSSLDADGRQALGRYSAHRLLPSASTKRGVFGNAEPLPEHVPPYLVRLVEMAPGLRPKTLERDGRPWVLKLGIECPLCASPSSPQRPGDSYISVRSGVYRCHHASCSAHQGLSFSEWIQRSAFGLERDQQVELVRMRSSRGRRTIDLVPNGAPKTSRGEVGLEILKSIADSHIGRIGVVSIPTGSGKTLALAMISVRLPGIALFFESYQRLEEFVATRDEYIAREKIDDALRVVVRKGVMRACAYKEQVERLGAERNIRSDVCGTCDLRKTCEAHATAKRGEVLLAVHASHASLRNEGALRNRVVVFDEAPVEFSTTRFAVGDVAHSLAGAGAAKRTEDARAISHVSRMLIDVLVAMSARWAISGRPQHGLHLSHDQLRTLFLTTDGVDVETLAVDLARLEIARTRRTATGAPDPMFPRLTLDDLKAARKKRPIPHRRGIEDLWDGVVPAIMLATGDEEQSAVDVMRGVRGEISGYVDGGGNACFELRRRRQFAVVDEAEPLDLGCVILSATGALHVERIRALDRACEVQLIGIDTAGAAPHMRVHVVSQSVARRDLITEGDLLRRATRPNAWSRTLGAVRAGLELVRGRHGDSVADCLRERVGVLTYMAVRQRLEGEEGWRAAQEAAGVRVLVHGHYGLDDVGSNEYLRQDVRLLVTLGHPSWHLGSIEADARFLGLDPETLGREMAAERLAQGEGRLRAGWDRMGEGVLTVHVHVGPEAPEHWREGSYSTALPSRHEARAAVDVAIDGLDGPVSFGDTERVKCLVLALRGGAANSFARSVKRKVHGPCERNGIGPGDPANAVFGLTDDACLTDTAPNDGLISPSEALALRRALLACGWVSHPVRSAPGRGRAATWAPPDWTTEQVEAWGRERCALLRAEGSV